MKTELKTIATETSQLFVEKENLLLSEIRQLQDELVQIKEAKKYTKEVRTRNIAIQEALSYKKDVLLEIRFAIPLKTGLWVQNGSSKPGKIIGLKLEGDNPVIEVDWVKSVPTLVTKPSQLQILNNEDLAYSWKGKGFEKLTRKLEPTECEDIETIESFKVKAQIDLDRAIVFGQPIEFRKREENRIAYCSQRIELLKNKDNIYNVLDGKPVSQLALNLKADSRRTEQEKLLIRQASKSKDYIISRDINVDDIICDPRCQQREQLDSEVIADYTEVLLNGGTLPAVKVMHDGSDYWLYDGFHTLRAATAARFKTITAQVEEGSLRDAILASVGVNFDHGLRRSNQTKRNAVMTLLKDEEWGKWSNVEIAKHCNVSEGLVRKIKKDNPIFQTSEIIHKDKHGNITKMNTKNIGNSTDGHFVQNEVNKNTNSTDGHFVQNEVNKNTNSFLAVPDPSTSANNVSMMLKVGQVVRVKNSDRIDQRLIGYKNSVATIKAKHEFSVDLIIWGQTIENVANQDISFIPHDEPLKITVSREFMEYVNANFDSLNSFESFVIDMRGNTNKPFKTK